MLLPVVTRRFVCSPGHHLSRASCLSPLPFALRYTPSKPTMPQIRETTLGLPKAGAVTEDDGNVPTITSFADVYSDDNAHEGTKRWNSLLDNFEKSYGRKAEFVSRSPGRVNLIGEHIDYSLYQVVPMAVAVDVLLAVSVRQDSKVCITNVDDKFTSLTFDLPQHGAVEIDAEHHHWTNYFKAGFRGACELLEKKTGSGKSVGMDIMVEGNVPAGGGLSSSAAFVCASALATMRANGEKQVNKTDLVGVAIVSERAVGVNSGGMDQSASVFPVRDSAILVSFKPQLKAELVSFPPEMSEAVFVVAQSFVISNKQETGPIHYNLRVVECTLAALLLAKIFGLKKPLPKDASPLGVSLRGFHDAFFEERDDVPDNTKIDSTSLKKQLRKLLSMTMEYVTQEKGYTRQELSEILQIPVSDLERDYIGKVRIRAERFKLRQRAMHVFSEALNVQFFMDIMKDEFEDIEYDSDQVMMILGAQMTESHRLCRDFYECSCPELDELCKIAKTAGSLGSRLTGAGWGGCSVHLVPKDKVQKVKDAWEQQYYRKKFPKITEAELKDAIVVSYPSRGSLVFELEGRGHV